MFLRPITASYVDKEAASNSIVCEFERGFCSRHGLEQQQGVKNKPADDGQLLSSTSQTPSLFFNTTDTFFFW